MSIEDAVLRWCAHGHTWIDQGDGTVSPSWGLGGTHMPVADPLLCPEPLRNDDGAIWCADCFDWKHTLGDCIRGLSFSPWERDDWCRAPEPACLAPAVGGNAWRDRNLPFDSSAWSVWWMRRAGPWLLTFHQGQNSRLWAATYDCLDIHTGDTFEVDRTWQARRASITELPPYLLDRWWKTENGTFVGCWSTRSRDGASWLIDRHDVEAWVRDGVQRGVADAGLQLTLEVDA
jgi:hypothetical protein